MDETIMGLLAIIGLFFVIPIVIFLIIRKVLSDRHKERMAMIERGINPSYRQAEPQPEKPLRMRKGHPRPVVGTGTGTHPRA